MDWGSLITGIGSFFGGQAEASGYDAAAAFYTQAAGIEQLSGHLKDLAAKRNIEQVAGGVSAVQTGAGLKMSGSALDVMHSNIQQGYLTKGIADLNTQLAYKSYMAQAAQAQAAANAASMGGIFGLLGGVVGLFSDDRLKTDIELVGRRGDGIGLYNFRYDGSTTKYIGVLASEVKLFRPDAIIGGGDYLRVNYEALGLEVQHA